MKAISLWPPYGSLIVAGVKKIETRSRRTNYRGVVAIHHTRSVPRTWVKGHLSSQFQEITRLAKSLLGDFCLDYGKVLGTVEIVDCFEMTLRNLGNVQIGEMEIGEYAPGRFMWMLANPIKFDKPIPAKGKQGLWEWEAP